MFGTTIGIAFGLTSVASGISLAFGGMGFVLVAAAIATALAIVLLALVPIPEKEVSRQRPTAGSRPGAPGWTKRIDIRGTIRAVKAVPGLFALIFFTHLQQLPGRGLLRPDGRVRPVAGLRRGVGYAVGGF